MMREGAEASSSAQLIPGVRRAVSLFVLRIADVATEGRLPSGGGGEATVEFVLRQRRGRQVRHALR